MGNLRVCFAIATLAACGSDPKQPDAGIILVDSPNPDAKVWNDAPPKNYDFTCFGQPGPTTAPANIMVSGATQEFSMSGSTAVVGAALGVYEKTNEATALANDISDSAGAFDLTNIPTGGTPIDGYIKAVGPTPGNVATHRTTFMYPPNPVDGNLADVPVIMFSNAFFDNIKTMLGGQNDETDGVLLFAVTDCSNSMQTLVSEATVTVEQNGTSEGVMIGLGIVDPNLAGTYLVTQVPEGVTDIKASYNGMNFPTKTVKAWAKPMGAGQPGTVTFTIVRPGP
jgi:hypothetical protein